MIIEEGNWQEVKKLKPRNNLLSSIVNCYSEDSDIADCFRLKYNNLYNSVPTEASCIESVKTCILNRIELCSDVASVITPSDVVKAVKSLNPGKGDGFKGLSSSHIIYGTNRLYILLSFLLRSIVVHGYVPSTMLRSVIVSIPKNPRQSLTTIDNYRGISLCSCFCKKLDLIIINKCVISQIFKLYLNFLKDLFTVIKNYLIQFNFFFQVGLELYHTVY